MHSTNFKHLNYSLIHFKPLWQHRAFYDTEVPWKNTYPALFEALLALDAGHAEQLAKDNMALTQWFEPHLPELCAQLSAIKINKSPPTNPLLSSRYSQAIPGRKWQQISAFSHAIPTLNHPIVEWCSGKAHLGRTLARHHQQTVYSLELDAMLCEAGQSLADHQGVAVELIKHDVLKPLPTQAQGIERAHIGLHACGELHITLLKTASQLRCPQIAISPCCYHKTPHNNYSPLSLQAKRAGLTLSKADMHLAQEETVTAGERVQKLRRKEQLWRLAFDLLQRQQLGSNSYQAIPSTPKKIFSEDFSNFCYWAAQTFGLKLNNNIDYERYLALGENRRQFVLKMDLVRQLFRRPLELWLALDRVLYLEEQGYQVNLSEFCERKTTPRNLLIYAQR